jgi:hypothetical protein
MFERCARGALVAVVVLLLLGVSCDPPEGPSTLVIFSVGSEQSAELWPRLTHVELVIDPRQPWVNEEGEGFEPADFEGLPWTLEERVWRHPRTPGEQGEEDALLEFVYVLDLADWSPTDESGEPSELPRVAVAPGPNELMPLQAWAEAYGLVGGEVRHIGRSSLVVGRTTVAGDTEEVDIPDMVTLACLDGEDNDLDGWLDLDDPDCAPDAAYFDGALGTYEWGFSGDPAECEDGKPSGKFSCNNGCDDDNDGWSDHEDPDCSSAEAAEDLPFGGLGECNDGFDNDNDGFADRGVDLNNDGRFLDYGEYPPDSDCTSARAEEATPLCANGRDDDGDGWVDLDDIDCENPGDETEVERRPDWPVCIFDLPGTLQPTVPPVGWPAVWPWDPLDQVTADGTVYPAACSDGCDSDGDLRIDGLDPECTDPFDQNEHSLDPACSDGIDNDGDLLIDLADPSCSSPNNPTEASACTDGYDNDGDGFSDSDDPECTSPTDNNELIP